jgi:aryl-alcohol dehydrogenase-like predicted oxidoreductase
MAPERSVHWLGDELQSKVAALLDYADEIEVPILSLAFSWLLSHAAVSSVIAGASNADQIRANAVAPRALSNEVVARLNELTS